MKDQGWQLGDVKEMATYERRYFLGLAVRKHQQKVSQYEKMQEQAVTSHGKSSRTTKLTGESLKAKMESGEIPLT